VAPQGDGLHHISTTERFMRLHRQSLEQPEKFWGPIADTFQWRQKVSSQNLH
jgi:hypothetical protein